MTIVSGSWRSYFLAALACALTTLIAAPLSHYVDSANIVVLFLLTVALTALKLGRGPGVLASFLSVVLFDFFCVPPRFSLTVADGQYALTFAVMLAVALIIGELMTSQQRQANAIEKRQRETQALYEMARELAGALTVDAVADIAQRFLWQRLRVRATILVPTQDAKLRALAHEPSQATGFLPVVAAEAYGGHAADGALDSDGNSYFALKAATRIRGVMVCAADSGVGEVLSEERKPLVQTVASLLAITAERLHYEEVARDSQVAIASERLRSSVLSAVSHDLRTPLTALVGLADSLMMSRPALPQHQHELASSLREQALLINSLVNNLLDMARLNAGTTRLNKEWQPIEEVIGSSIKLMCASLGDHRVEASIPRNFPLLEFDSVLMERVFCNLIENAAKYAPPATPIEIEVRASGAMAEMSVADRGPGVGDADPAQLFEMFVRGRRESPLPGVGLGLSICRSIIEAHGGTIGICNRPDGGAKVSFTLPLGNPPAIQAEPEEALGGDSNDRA